VSLLTSLCRLLLALSLGGTSRGDTFLVVRVFTVVRGFAVVFVIFILILLLGPIS
jgi:hypothetical protein